MDWKQKHADDALKAVRHPLVTDVIEEQLFNLNRKDDPLVKYGLTKIALYAATVARAQALGFDPDLLRLSPDEANQETIKRAERIILAGGDVKIIDSEEGG
jgi:hypothetical protein